VSKYRQASLHLYRSLLRECTYLPDSIARREISRQIIHRFRAHQPKKDGSSSRNSDGYRSFDTRIEKHLKTGRQALRTLQKANNGGLVSLRLVLRHAYGRTGKRRHELLQPLLQPSRASLEIKRKEGISAGTDDNVHPWDLTTVPIPDIFVAKKHKSKAVIEYHIDPQYGPLKAILVSQSRLSSHLHNVLRIKEHIPHIPTTNSWGRSMPRKRVKNLAIKNYSHLIDRVLPPLPEEEWTRLFELVNGSRELEQPPKRRKKQESQKPDHLRQQDLETLIHLDQVNAALQTTTGDRTESHHSGSPVMTLETKPARRLLYFDPQDTWFTDEESVDKCKQQILEEELLLGPRFAVHRNRQNDPHYFKERFTRRQLAVVFSECPRAYWDTQQGSWKVDWGMKNVKPEPKVSTLTPLFESLNMYVSKRQLHATKIPKFESQEP